MYLLDTDHLSVLERGGTASQRLRRRLQVVPVQPDTQQRSLPGLSLHARSALVLYRKTANTNVGHHQENPCPSYTEVDR